MKKAGMLVTGASLLIIAGCGSNDVIIKKQTEMDARMEQLVQGYASVQARLSEVSADLKDLQSQVKKGAAEAEESKAGLRELQASLETVRRKQVETPPPAAPAPAPVQTQIPVQAPAVPKIEVISKDSAPRDKETTAQDAYMKAFGLFGANDYAKAIAAFESFIKTYPDSEFAGNARYWIGECYYTQRDYRQALESFRRVIAEYPKGNKVPDAMLKLGLTYQSLNDPAKAKETFQTLIDKYPKSPSAAKARERLGKL